MLTVIRILFSIFRLIERILVLFIAHVPEYFVRKPLGRWITLAPWRDVGE